MHGHRPTYVEIDLGALRHNFRQVQARAEKDCGTLAVVKADAYGHGAEQIAPLLEESGADMFGVAIVEEGVELRRAGVTRPILVLGGIYPGQYELLLEHRLVPCLYDIDAARRLNAVADHQGRECAFHLKIDTGMGRVGFLPEELPETLKILSGLKQLRLEGVISHFAVADDPPHPFTDEQIGRFRQCLEQVRRAGFAPRYIHVSNSAALFSRELPECNLVRPGIVLYGAMPSEAFRETLDLRPVMSFRSAVAQVKTVPPGAGISYGHRFVAGRPSVIAAVPVGYADGYNRLLSCCGEVLVRGRRAPVAGAVCMDWILVDVTDIPDVAVGDEVTLLGRDNGNVISAEEWAQKIDTIPYEVFCQVSKRVPRIMKDDG